MNTTDAPGQHPGDPGPADPGPTEPGPYEPGPGAPPPPPASPVSRLDQLRRSVTDRQLAGVAGGLGRHFGIDPTVVRVLLVVSTLFGGAGLIVYVVVWLFVPSDGAAEAPIRVGSDGIKIVLIGAAVVAVLMFLGATGGQFGVMSGWAFAWPLPVVIVGTVVAVVLVSRNRSSAQPPGSPPHPGAPMAGPPPPWSSAAPTFPAGSSAGPPTGPPIAFHQEPAYVIPPRPRRTGPLLFWPTVAVVAIALGVLGLYDVDHAVSPLAYPALALALIGAGLTVGACFGRAGGLIAVGLFVALVMGLTSVITAVNDGTIPTRSDVRDVQERPTTSAEVLDSYEVPVGAMELDLTEVTDPAALGGRTIEISVNVGSLWVQVPETINARVDARIRYAGEVRVFDRVSTGTHPALEHDRIVSEDPATPTLTLVLTNRVGDIEVTAGDRPDFRNVPPSTSTSRLPATSARSPR